MSSALEFSSSHTSGRAIVTRICSGPATREAIFSGFSSAMRLGTISPTTTERAVIAITTRMNAISLPRGLISG